MELLISLAVIVAGVWYYRNKKRPDYDSQVKGSGGDGRVEDPTKRG